MSSEDPWSTVGAAQYVSLGTYRRDGTLVTTPVWIAPAGDALVVTTGRSTWTAKRLNNDPRVVIRPCTARGTVAPDAVTLEAVGVIAGPASDVPEGNDALRRKYGLQFSGYLLMERLVHAIRRRPDDRVILRITRS